MSAGLTGSTPRLLMVMLRHGWLSMGIKKLLLVRPRHSRGVFMWAIEKSRPGYWEISRTFLVTNFPLARSVGDDDALLSNGVLDSLGILEVVTFVEQEFAITIIDDELVPENFQSISRLGVFVQAKLNGSS